PERTQQPPSTPPALPRPAIEDLVAPVINLEAVDSFLHKFHASEKDKQEIKQADQSIAILESIRSQVPSVVKDYLRTSLPDAFQKMIQSHIEELKKEAYVKKEEYKDFIQETVANEESLTEFELKKILIDKIKRKDKDEDPLAGPNQDKETKKRRTGKETESSKNSSTPKESTKKDWFKDSPKPEVLDLEWNTVKAIGDTPEQPWFN
ncbi:hypothetical protein Tco_0995980, partial [Tanacetum coccineum]